MVEQGFSCLLCGGTDWCGRPCMHDPHKSNGLLFHRDGRAKTLKERGLGWDDPAPKVIGLVGRKSRGALRRLAKELMGAAPANKGANSPANSPANKGGPANKPDRKTYMRELMRQRRAAAKAARRALEGGGVGGGTKD